MPLFNSLNEFLDLYRTYATEALVTIVTTEKENYQSAAVDAARQILEERGIDADHISPGEEQEEGHYAEYVPGHEHMYNEEIRERMASGESAESVLMDLRSRGFSSLEFAPAMAKEDNITYGGERERRAKKMEKAGTVVHILKALLHLMGR